MGLDHEGTAPNKTAQCGGSAFLQFRRKELNIKGMRTHIARYSAFKCGVRICDLESLFHVLDRPFFSSTANPSLRRGRSGAAIRIMDEMGVPGEGTRRGVADP
jgi:hypothetical protein